MSNPHPQQSQHSENLQQPQQQQSLLRLINSQHLTLEMAVNYLFQCRKNPALCRTLLHRIQQFCLTKSVHFIPTIIFIMGLDSQDQFFDFCESLAHSSLPLYLTVRWSFSAYSAVGDSLRNRLDSSLMARFRYTPKEEAFNEAEFTRNLHKKQQYSNYLSVINDFFDRLFRIPEKLKKYEKPARNDKLRGYLDKITAVCLKDQGGYMHGIAFPVEESSPIAVRVLADHSFTFSTKERVPFKIVFQTVSCQDAVNFKPRQEQPKLQGQTHKITVDKQPHSQKLVNEPKSQKVRGQQKQKSQKLRGQQKQTNKVQSQQGHTPSPEDKKNRLILPQTYFGELWQDAEDKIKRQSPYEGAPSYKIRSFLIKSGDDLRQEYMAMQLIKLIEDITIKENLTIWVRAYSVIPFNEDSGLIEFVTDTRTVSWLKQKSQEKSLRRIYQQMFGENWEESVTNFIKSLAGYSLIQYLFQIKDRHNNNILIDTHGHMIHIDFSFILSSSPGNMNFERAPFKLTADYIELMEGRDSDIFAHFRLLFFLGLKFLRKYKKEIMDTVVMMSHCQMKCFEKFDKEAMEKRFHDTATDEQLEGIVDHIMDDAYSSYTTGSYDKYQWYTNFIYS